MPYVMRIEPDEVDLIVKLIEDRQDKVDMAIDRLLYQKNDAAPPLGERDRKWIDDRLAGLYSESKRLRVLWDVINPTRPVEED
jgi:hypothetical protein